MVGIQGVVGSRGGRVVVSRGWVDRGWLGSKGG